MDVAAGWHRKGGGRALKAESGCASVGMRERPATSHFIIIGAMKCGTTSLYRYLGAHPDVGLSREKETDFFLAERNFARGVDWYFSQFSAGAQVCGEASPNYTKYSEFPGVPERIFKTSPNAKLVYIVRDPVDRFLSQYLHHLTTGEVRIPQHEILKSEAGRNYLACSRYYQQMVQYLRFYPQDRIFVASFDELCDAPQALLRRLFAFLGVDSEVTIEDLGRVYNQRSELEGLPAWYFQARRSPFLRAMKHRLPPSVQSGLKEQLRRWPQRQIPVIDEELRASLRGLLREDVSRFRQVTGIPFDSWSL